MQAFRALAEERGICIAASASISSGSKPSEFDKIVDTLDKAPTAHVVVCFCEGITVTKLLKATRRKDKIGKYLVIGSDGWANRKEVVRNVEEEAIGAISIKPHTEHYHDFDSYYFNLRPENNTRNPWFRGFWQERFNCLLPPSDIDPPLSTFHLDSPSNCTGEESLEDGYNQDTKMSFVVNAIYTVAYGLHNLQQRICGVGTVGLCPDMQPIDGRELLDALFNVSFVGMSGDHIKFDEDGDPPGKYDIYNFQRSSDGRSYNYVTVGAWEDGILTLNDSIMMWNNGSDITTRSFCSQPCPPHHAKNIRDNVKCCWACVPCKDNEYMLDEYTCKSCDRGWWPNSQLNDCYEIEAEYMKWHEVQAIAAMCFSCVGILMTIFVTVTFIRHNDTALVKASSRENSYILLSGIYLCFLVTFPYIAKPSTVVCYFRRIGLGLSFCICYAGLVVRTNRMARILAGSKKKILTRKPRFLGSTAQVVMTFGVISFEIGIIVATLVLERPAAILDYPDLRRVRLICNTTTFGFAAPLGYDALLISLCTLYAFKTRNLPENFNEAKYIAFTMYTTCIVWLAFIPLYFGSDLKEIVVCFAVSLSATVTLGCLFFPKTYIILLKPERNRRSSMTTSNLVRMHVGSFSELAPCRSNSSSNGTMDGCNEKLLGGERNAVGVRGNRKKNSPLSGSSHRDKSRERNRDRSPGIFSALRRRKRPNNTKHMKAVQRDRLLSKRKQPLYRYGNSTNVTPSSHQHPSPVEEGDSSMEKALEERLSRAEEASRAMGCLKPSRTVQGREGDVKNDAHSQSALDVEMEIPVRRNSGTINQGQRSVMKNSQSNERTCASGGCMKAQSGSNPRPPLGQGASTSKGAVGQSDSKPQAHVLPLRVRRSFSDETINKKQCLSRPSSSANTGGDPRFLGVDRQQHTHTAGGSFNQIYPDLLQVLPTADAESSPGAPSRGQRTDEGQSNSPSSDRIHTQSDVLPRESVKRSVRFDERTLAEGDDSLESGDTRNIDSSLWSEGDHVVTIPNEILGVLTSIKSSDV
ncbi:metabotropic glutamate receptor 1-like [Lytechinus variegatus]|uniref:metabotropic glutamate receptor 1-like n=1 Tax=Lytechinus variegatus TaxID=7654 RepID=UPI001BB0E7C3|nr:metabotropic glutamate receptor 1-like [Lytechinus variegatus]